MKRDRQVLKFLHLLTGLEIIEAVGIARLLGVELLIREDNSNADEQKMASVEEKDYDILLSEMIDAFIKTSKSKRKFIINLMEAANAGTKN